MSFEKARLLTRWWTAAAVILVLIPRGAALAQDAYFAITFSYQDGVNTPRRSHSFASFLRVRDGAIVERVDIGWSAAPGYLVGNGYEMPPLRTVPGRNYTLEQSLEAARCQGRRVARFGPYPVHEALFRNARAQRARLESGRVAYKMLDFRFRPSAVNCIHAISDTAGFVMTGTMRGHDASRFLVRHFASRGYLLAWTRDEAVFLQLLAGLGSGAAALGPNP